jgi:hypothetical protein
VRAPRAEGEAHALLSHLEPLLPGRAVLVPGPDGALEASRTFLGAIPGALTWDGSEPGEDALLGSWSRG